MQSGTVLGMGKGFHCVDAVKGHDLGEIICQACQRAVRPPCRRGSEVSTDVNLGCERSP